MGQNSSLCGCTEKERQYHRNDLQINLIRKDQLSTLKQSKLAMLQPTKSQSFEANLAETCNLPQFKLTPQRDKEGTETETCRSQRIRREKNTDELGVKKSSRSKKSKSSSKSTKENKTRSKHHNLYSSTLTQFDCSAQIEESPQCIDIVNLKQNKISKREIQNAIPTDCVQKQSPPIQCEESRSTCLSDSGLRSSESFQKQSNSSPATKEEEIEEFKAYLRKFVSEEQVQRMADEVSNNWRDFEGTLLQQSPLRHQRVGKRSLVLIKEVDNSREEEDSYAVGKNITFKVDEWRQNLDSEEGSSRSRH